MKSINLLPKSVNRDLQLELIGKQLMGFWVRAVILMVIFFLLSLATIVYLQSEIGSAEQSIKQNKETLSSSDTKALQTRVQALNNSIANLKSLQDQHYYWSTALIELANLVPADIELDSVVLDRATNRIDLAGRARTRDSAILFWAAIKKDKMFRDINFPLKNLEKAQDSDFTFTFYVNPSELKQNEATD